MTKLHPINVTSFLSISIKTLFNSCERLLLGTFLLLNKIGDYPQIQASERPYPTQTGKGLRHASGPVHVMRNYAYIRKSKQFYRKERFYAHI